MLYLSQLLPFGPESLKPAFYGRGRGHRVKVDVAGRRIPVRVSFGEKLLDGDMAVESGIECSVRDSEAPLPQHFLDAVTPLPKHCSGRQKICYNALAMRARWRTLIQTIFLAPTTSHYTWSFSTVNRIKPHSPLSSMTQFETVDDTIQFVVLGTDHSLSGNRAVRAC